jgi:hypothetical protein
VSSPFARTFALIFVLAAACGPPSLKARLANAERRATEAERLLDEGEKDLRDLEPALAQDKLTDAQRAIEDPDFAYYPERELISQRLDAARKRLPAVRKAREERDLQQEVDARRAAVEQRLAVFEAAREGLTRKAIERAQVDAARETSDALFDAIEDGKDLEGRDDPYYRWVSKHRDAVSKVRAELPLAEARAAFIAGPGALRREGQTLHQKALALKREPDRKKDLLEEARDKLLQCAKEARGQLEAQQQLAKAAIVIDGALTTPQAVTKACEAQGGALEAQLNPPPPPPRVKKPSRKTARRR